MRSNILLLLVALCYTGSAIALAIKPITASVESHVHKRSILAIAGDVYRNVERHVVEIVAPVSRSITDIESDILSTSEVDKRGFTRTGSGPPKRSPEIDGRGFTRPGNGPPKRSPEIDGRGFTRPGNGPPKRSPEIETRSFTRPGRGPPKRSPEINGRGFTRTGSGPPKRSPEIDSRGFTRPGKGPPRT